MKPILKNTRVVFLILFLSWLPYWFIYFPGLNNWDTINQLKDLYTGNKPMPFRWISGQASVECFLNNHHPVFDTFVFAAFVELGKIVGGPTFSMALYGLCSLAGTAAAMTYMIQAFDALKIREVYHHLAIALLALMPFVPMYGVMMLKDFLFSIFFVVYLADAGPSDFRDYGQDSLSLL